MDKDKWNAYHRSWQKLNPEKYKEIKKRYYLKKNIARYQKIIELNIKAPRASKEVYEKAYTINRSLVVSDVCLVCGGRFKNIQKHHNDYSNLYEVIPLCRGCHKLVHMMFRKF